MKYLMLKFIAAYLALGAVSVMAADFPSKPIRMIVPFPAGGTADVLPRIVAERLRAVFPNGVIVENRPGAGGNIGAEVVASAERDGHTILVSPPGPIAINQSLYPKLGYDQKKWVPVTVIATVPNVLAVSQKVPVKTVQEFIAYVKANPGKVSYASQGNGSTSHLTANLFQSVTSAQMVHVPYKGTAPALTDLAGGQIDVFFDNLSSSASLHKSGRIRILAVADRKRSSVLPNVPTFAESGLPSMQAVTWFGVVAPEGTPQKTVQALQVSIAEVLKQQDVRQKFAEQGAEAIGNQSDEMAKFISSETARWSKVIREANVTID